MLEAIQIALALAGTVFLPPSLPELQVEFKGEIAVIPISTERGQTDVQVYFGERGPYRFQIDTYASYEMCIDDDLARELGLKTLRKSTNSDGFTSRSVDIVGVDELRLSGVTFRNLEALVDDYESIPARGGSLQGLLGFPLFRELLLTVDYPQQQVSLRRGELGADEAGVVPMLLGGGGPDVHVMIGDKRVKFGLDSGAGLAVRLHERDLETIAHYGEAPVIGKARMVYSERAIRGAFLEPTLEFAGLEFDAVYGFFSEGSKSITKRLMGQRLLRDCRLTFDQRKRRLQVIREPRPPAIELSPERLQEWVGEYSNAARSLTIRLEEGSLRVRFLGRPELVARPIEGDLLVFPSSAMRLLWVADSKHGRGLRVLRSADLSADWFAAAQG